MPQYFLFILLMPVMLLVSCAGSISPEQKFKLEQTTAQAEQAEEKILQLEGEKNQLEAELAREKESLSEYLAEKDSLESMR